MKKVLPIRDFKRLFEDEFKRRLAHVLGIDFDLSDDGRIEFYDHSNDPENLVLPEIDMDAARFVSTRLIRISTERFKSLGFAQQPVDLDEESSVEPLEAVNE